MKKSFIISRVLSAAILLSVSLPAHAANHYANGLRAELGGDTSEALGHYRLSAGQGVSDANFAIARLLDASGDDQGAFEHYIKAAKAGNSFAQYSLGMRYKTGNSASPSDRSQSLYWLLAAAKKGHGEAALAAFELNSDNRLLLLAADQGVDDAVKLVAKSYHLGLNGFEKDSVKGDQWLEKMSSVEERE